MLVPRPPDEQDRLAALRELQVLDTPPETALDELVGLASQIFTVPIALVSLVDEDRQWFKARLGLDLAETPREISFCAHSILGEGVMEVPDAIHDERFRDNPLVTADPAIRFYAGAPLATVDGHRLGTLCIIDRQPRRLSEREKETLAVLARAVTAQLELGSAVRRANLAMEQRRLAEEELRRTSELRRTMHATESALLTGRGLRETFDEVLNVLLRLTGSEYGFIGEILRQPDGQPYLKTHAITDIAWNDETRSFYDEHAPQGMEFTNLRTLFGAVMTSGAPVIANHPGSDPRRGGLPPGHPALNSFLGVPFFAGAELAGMIGVANGPGGYDDQVVERLGPILDACATMVSHAKLQRGRKAAEAALRDSEERYRLVLENALDAVVGMDSEGRVSSWGRQAEVIFGWSEAEARGRLLGEMIVPQRHREAHRRGMERYLATNESRVIGRRIELSALRRDGEEFPVELTVSAIHSQNGVAFSAFVRDVTERKRAEREILERGNELSAANAELSRSSRLKDEFLASMSHELRTPLNAVLGLSEGLRAGVFGELRPLQVEQVAMIEDSGRHLLDLINDVLDLSKIEAGKLEIQPVTVAVDELCQACLRMVRESAHQKQLRIKTSLDSALPSVEADPLRLKQILVNLLSNAIKFTSPGGAIGLETDLDPESGEARFVVWDTGIGIANEDLPRLFRPFAQLDSSLSRKHSGTGLGLSLVRRLAELHGGGVGVESTLGRGSRFWVTLPPPLPRNVDAGGGEASQTGRLSAGAVAPGAAFPSPETGAEGPLVLLAEDHEINIRTVTAHLASLGYRVAVARDGREAVARTREERPAVVLMDIQMPEMDGITAIRELRKEEATAGIPIIALTALAMPGDRERCLEAGANEYLSKPVRLRDLALVLRLFTAKAHAARD